MLKETFTFCYLNSGPNLLVLPTDAQLDYKGIPRGEVEGGDLHGQQHHDVTSGMTQKWHYHIRVHYSMLEQF